MELEMRPLAPEEMKAFARAVDAHFGESHGDDEGPGWCEYLDPARCLVVWDAGEIVGNSGAWALEQTMPGGQAVAVAGITVVGVSATHRRQGLLNRMMAGLLDDAVERGEPIAILTASESIIYGRYGFGWATSLVGAEVARDHSAFIAPVEVSGRIRRIDKDAMLKTVPALHDRVRRARLGDITIPGGHWDRLAADRPAWRNGGSELFYVVHESEAGEPDGFAAYRYKHDWPNGVPGGTAHVAELFGESPEVEVVLFRYLADLDLIATVNLHERPVDDHLRLRLADPRRYIARGTSDHVWVRLVDVAAGLGQRAYAGDGSVVIEVSDRFRPQNDGRYRVGNGVCGRDDSAEPDLALPVESLGAAFLGGRTFSALARAGRAAEVKAGGLARADALFATGVEPFCDHGF
jgi:predicted acetyltransferase